MIDLRLKTGRAIAQALAAALVLPFVACSGAEVPTAQGERPNVLWIVWDTVRADRLSVYGYERPTTPFLERWSKDARVFEDCVSTAGSTVPSHASMFTGLLPSEHGANYSNQKLNRRFSTIAEIFEAADYDTFLYAANPHIQSTTDFDQGFGTSLHPWSDEFREEATAIVRRKIPSGDSSSHLVRKLQNEDAEVGDWNLMASGALAEKALSGWLEDRDDSTPYFAFLNYMEAHAPYIPPREYREAIIASPEAVDRSYDVDNRAVTRWAYSFRLLDYDPEDLELLGAIYDATLLELDGLFERLIARLEAGGHLENTIVVLTSDHGEQLGEHHMIDHQYALYDTILRVPLIVQAPSGLAAGRDDAPVSTFDLFPTLLELAGLDLPAGLRTQAVSLLSTDENRRRLAEYPTPFEQGFRKVQRFDPEFDPTPWNRRLRALYAGGEKLICSSDGEHELYDRARDPQELDERFSSHGELGEALLREMTALGKTLQSAPGTEEAEFSEEELEMLRSLGYLGDEDDTGELDSTVQNVTSCGY